MWVRNQISIGLLVVIVADIASAAGPDEPTLPDARSPSTLTAPSTPRDSALITAVWDRIRRDQIVDPTTIEVDAEHGTVTLTGMQSMLVACDRATHIAETVPGVLRVDNRLMIRRGEREVDTQKLESDVLYVLLTDPATARSAIMATTDADGHVILAGSVPSYGERYMAEQLVRSVAGVRKVTSQLAIKASAPIEDRNLAASVSQALHWDAYINNRDIHVSARRGVVTLKGELQTLAEKRRAVELSRAAGARKVSAADLRISGGASRVHAGTPADRSADDQAIAAASRRVLKLDPRLADLSIDIRADHGVVTLKGSVPSLAAKRAALWLVRGIRGVQSTNDVLRVSEEARLFSDAEARLRIERALMRNSLTREDSIAVSVHEGTVTLEGDASSWLSRQFAEDAAASVMGIGTVQNEIVITNGSENRASSELAASTIMWWIPGASAAPAVANAFSHTSVALDEQHLMQKRAGR